MSIVRVITAAVVVGAVGLLIGVLLDIISEKLKVEVNEREILTRNELPDNNCGGCGYSSCDGFAKAITEGGADVGACPVGGAPVVDEIAAIVGVSAGGFEKKTVFVRCKGTCDKAKVQYNYYGLDDCKKISVVPGASEKACIYGCMGCGFCMKVYTFDAIHVADGIALVDKEGCIVCGKCVISYPNGLIEPVPYSAEHLVQCGSHDKGKDVRTKREAGRIGYALCIEQCEFDAIHVDDNVVVIGYGKCTNHGKYTAKCPTKVAV